MSVVFKKKTSDEIFFSIDKFLRNKLKASLLSITNAQLMNIYQATDVEYNNSIKELHKHFNTAVGTNKNVKISLKKLNHAVLLLLAYKKNIIVFENSKK